MKLRLLVLSLLLTMVASTSPAEPVKVGDAAPDVSGITDTGESLRLADVYHQQVYTLVYFFPKADTPGCTKQGCSLRDAYERLTKMGVAVIGVSADKVDEQKAFKAKYHLPFTLIADPDHKVINAFGVPVMPIVGFATRQAYLIRGGKIVWADYKASTDKQADDVIRVIGELK